MLLPRRAVLTGLATALCTPAIVRAGALMPIRALAPADHLVTRLDVLYGHMYVRPEWVCIEEAAPFTLDTYAKQILQPMLTRLAQHVVAQEEFNLRRSRDIAFFTGAEWPSNAPS